MNAIRPNHGVSVVLALVLVVAGIVTVEGGSSLGYVGVLVGAVLLALAAAGDFRDLRRN